jgi:hypothetical protein
MILPGLVKSIIGTEETENRRFLHFLRNLMHWNINSPKRKMKNLKLIISLHLGKETAD